MLFFFLAFFLLFFHLSTRDESFLCACLKDLISSCVFFYVSPREFLFDASKKQEALFRGFFKKNMFIKWRFTDWRLLPREKRICGKNILNTRKYFVVFCGSELEGILQDEVEQKNISIFFWIFVLIFSKFKICSAIYQRTYNFAMLKFLITKVIL